MALSFSQITLYQRCPKQYEFACIKKLPRTISAGESFGSSVHNTLAKFGRDEIAYRTSQNSSGDQIALFEEPVEQKECSLGQLIDYWHDSFIVQGYDSKKYMEAARMKGEEMMKLYFAWWSEQEREVVAIEKGFRLPLGNVELTGRFDRVEQIEGGLKVIDFKTSAVRSQEDIDADLQLSVYAMACASVLGQSCKELSLLFLREDGITEVVTTRSDDQLQEAKTEIAAVQQGIDDGVFDALPDVNVCGRCPYKGVCDFAKK